jgi:hypothetical protein
MNLGNLTSEAERYKEAEELYRRSMDLGQRLVTDEPTEPDHRSLLAHCHHNLGANVLRNTERHQEAAGELRRAQDL